MNISPGKGLENLVVDEDRMVANLESTKGLVYSQAVLLELIDTGMTRDEAYRLVQRNAMKTWDGEGTLVEHLLGDGSLLGGPPRGGRGQGSGD